MKKVSQVDEVVEALRGGKIVVFPTDTVWGVGVASSNGMAISKLYQIMNREQSKPTAILVGDMGEAERLGVMSERARVLAKEHWPGALTLVVEARSAVDEQILGKERAVGLRMPEGKMGEVLKKLGEGVVASSANVAGGVTPRSLAEVEPEFLKKVDVVWEMETPLRMKLRKGAEELSGAASTVVDVRGEEVKILRQREIKI